jgi:hypothetical protein
MFDLQPPRHISTLRILPVPARCGGGRLTKQAPAFRLRAGTCESAPLPSFLVLAVVAGWKTEVDPENETVG